MLKRLLALQFILAKYEPVARHGDLHYVIWQAMEAYFAKTFNQSQLIFVDVRQFTSDSFQIFVRFCKESNHRSAPRPCGARPKAAPILSLQNLMIWHLDMGAVPILPAF